MSKCSNGYCKFDSYTTTKINNMFKIKENDLFAKNMSNAELYQVWQDMKSTKEINKICAKLIVQLDKKYNYDKK